LDNGRPQAAILEQKKKEKDPILIIRPSGSEGFLTSFPVVLMDNAAGKKGDESLSLKRKDRYMQIRIVTPKWPLPLFPSFSCSIYFIERA